MLGYFLRGYFFRGGGIFHREYFLGGYFQCREGNFLGYKHWEVFPAEGGCKNFFHNPLYAICKVFLEVFFINYSSISDDLAIVFVSIRSTYKVDFSA